MIIRDYKGILPRISSTAKGGENITIVGDVTIGEHVSLWYGAVLRGDASPITLGDYSNVQDNATVHGCEEYPTTVGKNVVIGHNAIIHGCTIADNCLIGMGATILTGAIIGEGSIIGAGALIPEHKVIPPRSLVVGIPARVVRTTTDEEVAGIPWSANHYATVFADQLLPIKAEMK